MGRAASKKIESRAVYLAHSIDSNCERLKLSAETVAAFTKLLKPANALVLALLGVFAYFIYLYTRARFVGPISFDEESVVWGGWLMTQGGVPYRDFFEPKPPVIFFANYLGLLLFGFKDSLFRIVPTFLALLSILVFYLALVKRKVVPWLAALLTAQVALWLLGPEFHDSGLNDSETYGLAFTLLGFSFGSLSGPLENHARRLPLQILSGICFGLAIFSKELFLFSVAPAWLLAARGRAGRGWDWRQLLFSATGAAAVALALLIYLVSHSAFGPYLDLVGFYRTFAANYCIDIGQFPRVSGLSVVVPSWSIFHRVLYNFGHLAFALALWAALVVVIRRRANSNVATIEIAIALVAVVLGMIAVSIGHCFWAHYFLLGMTGLILLSVMGAEALSGFLAGKGATFSVIVFTGLLVLLLFVGYDPTKEVLKERPGFQHVPWDPLLIQTIEQHSKPGDYILTTEGPLLYVALNRRSPLGINFFVDEILPYVTAQNRVLQMEILRADLEKHLPKVCYFAPWLRSRQEKYHELLFDPLLIKHNYTRVNDSIWYLPDR
jgi:4-amino-4-deoxy-L-arabinose transferase-like glycosyltransferase